MRRNRMKDRKEENRPKENNKVNKLDEQDTGVIRKGLDDINSGESNSKDNVVSDVQSEVRNRKHGRDHGEPLTGSTPKTD